jgi:hypothetical protein
MIAEAALDHAAVLDLDLAVEGRAETEDDPLLHLGLDDRQIGRAVVPHERPPPSSSTRDSSRQDAGR